MKKLYILFVFSICLLFANQVSAQKAEKQKADTTKACKPTKSGKHCAKPTNG